MKSLKERIAEREQREADAAKDADTGAKTSKKGASAEEAEEGYESWTVAELKAELETRDLPTSGNKADLIAALEENDAA